MKNLTHASAWYSPRGFCNEGTYLFGTGKEIKGFFDKISGDCESGWGCQMNHRSFEAARKRCEKQAAKDIRSHHANNELGNIGFCNVAEMLISWGEV